ncbi:MAG TPA: hypothetical protein VLJ79_06785 [Candidatus Binatia bacterium]|nr:hypothetical protein [Candidatus Binatia bacterium]
MRLAKTVNFPATLLIVICLLTAQPAFSQTPYYAGKTITIIRGGGAGGSGEFQSSRLLKNLPESFDSAQDERTGFDIVDDFPFMLRFSKHS